jgi:heparan-sulfate lyase
MRKILAICSLISTLAVPVLAQETEWVTVEQELSLRDVLELVDVNRPGLEQFARAMADDDLAAAQRLLIEYFATRTNVVIPPPEFPGIGFSNSMMVLGTTTPEQADEWLKHVFTMSNNDAGTRETYDLGPEIKWADNPSEASSWALYLNQLNHLNRLAGLYSETGDERYALEVGHSVLTWTQQCPRTYGSSKNGRLTKSGMEVRNRLCNLLSAYDVLRASPSLTDDMHLAFWKVFITHARELMEYSETSYPGRIAVAVLYPEFTEHKMWLDAGVENLRSTLVEGMSPEGARATHSISYQKVPVPWSARMLELLRANPESGDFSDLADMVETGIGKILGVILWISMPNGGMPNIGDTYGRGDWNAGTMQSSLEAYIHSQLEPEQQERLNAIDDPLLRLQATLALVEGVDGPQPETTSIGLPGSGYYIMRSGWDGPQERYLYFDLSSQALGHAHNDACHFDFYGYGKPLLVDTGDYHLGWGYRACLHNTIEVDEQDQARGARAPMMPHEWLTTDGFDLVDGAHGAYEHLGVYHRRKMIFVKPDYMVLCDLLTGEGDHKYEQFFHFAGPEQRAAAQARLTAETQVTETVHDDTANIKVMPVHTEGLQVAFAEAQDTDMKPTDKSTREAMLGWMVTAGTFQRIKAPVAVYSREGVPPQAFHDVLYPTPAGTQATVTTDTLPVTEGERTLQPWEAVGIVVQGELHRARYVPDEIQMERGDNFALGKPGFAEINQTRIAPTTDKLTDGDPAARTIGGAISSEPFTLDVLLEGRFTVDFEQEAEVNLVVLHHGTWNGSDIIYPAEELAVQYWDGVDWRNVEGAETMWHDGYVSETAFEPVRTTRLSAAVRRPSGGRLAMREFEAFLVPEAEKQRVAALRAEMTTEHFTDAVLVSHSGPGLRQYGDYTFDGELAIVRRNGEGAVTALSVKNGANLTGPGLHLQAPNSLPYCNIASITVADGTAMVEALTAAGLTLSLDGRDVSLQMQSDGRPAPQVAEGVPPQISNLQVQMEPSQKGLRGAQPSALLTWQTDRPAVSQVFFEEAGMGLRRTPLQKEFTTDHAVRVYFLRPQQEYEFRAVSIDESGRDVSGAIRGDTEN